MELQRVHLRKTWCHDDKEDIIRFCSSLEGAHIPGQ